MQHSFSTLGCPDDSLDEVMALAAKHGITALELRALGGTVELPAYFGAGWGEPAALATHVANAGCRVIALDTSFRLIGNSTEDRRALRAFLPWAEALGGVNLRVFDGGQVDAVDLEEALVTLQWWHDERASSGWRSDLMIETHDSLVTADAIQALADRAPAGGVRLLWDAHHTWKKGGEDPVVTWEAIAPMVRHVHVKDSVSTPSARHDFTYVLPGDGEFPMRELRSRLSADSYAGPLSLEWERKWHPYLPPLADALALADARRWW